MSSANSSDDGSQACIKTIKRPRLRSRKKNRAKTIFHLRAAGFALCNAIDALARANGPSGLCNDVTRPFWIVWRTAGSEREVAMTKPQPKRLQSPDLARPGSARLPLAELTRP